MRGLKFLTAKFLKQGYRYYKLRNPFSKFYRRHSELVSKFKVGFKSPLQQGLTEPECCGDFVYKLWAQHKASYLSWMGLDSIGCCLTIRGLPGGFLLHRYFNGVDLHPRGLRVSQYVVFVPLSLISDSS